jgi:signal peptidase II
MSGEPVARPIRDAVADAELRRAQRGVRKRWVVFAIAATVTFVADQITKIIVRAGIEPGERIDLFLGVHLVRARNEGIAFGLFPGNRAVVATLTIVALAIIAVALLRLARQSPGVALGGGLLVGGSLGNLVDRLVHGGVTDFIDPPAFPAFNVADIGITFGAIIVALSLLRAGGRE